ncbi:prevent-host-death protein [Pseudidiomarina salinarum]|uniref:Antitoxin n=1 Tax=Pseudidiomarina salinarum TaxID=435908 RepID=A0A094ISG6_9GAMM|nr:prevent-host-death protein [Pseudidiomarina salinarum]RUO69308.1 type II toxin-antitoxin system prevent-host-death family antitoxin [Pseudidiomarina salinarum]
MKVISYSEARSGLKRHMEAVCEDHIPTVITNQRGKPVVLLSLEDFSRMEETIHLLSSPENASRLADSIAQLKAGKSVSQELNDAEKE